MCCFPAERISSVMAGDGGRDNAGVPLRPAGVTLLLAGNMGNGKSAIGNSILGWEAFASKRSFGSVTDSCQMESGKLHDGRTVNVIDTPGLVKTAGVTVDVGKVTMECMSMAKDGIHAVLIVFSAMSRFSEEETVVVDSKRMMFGERIVLVFTHGDDVEMEEFRDMLSAGPEYMLEIVRLSGGRVVLFDNRTKDTEILAGQCKKLLHKVDSIMTDHQGHPFSEQMHPVIKVEEVEEGKIVVVAREEEEEDDDGGDEKDEEEEENTFYIEGFMKITKFGVKNEVSKSWYARTCEFFSYTADLVWNNIYLFWRNVVDAVTSRVDTMEEQLRIVPLYLMEQRGWFQRPRQIASYR